MSTIFNKMKKIVYIYSCFLICLMLNQRPTMEHIAPKEYKNAALPMCPNLRAMSPLYTSVQETNVKNSNILIVFNI